MNDPASESYPIVSSGDVPLPPLRPAPPTPVRGPRPADGRTTASALEETVDLDVHAPNDAGQSASRLSELLIGLGEVATGQTLPMLRQANVPGSDDSQADRSTLVSRWLGEGGDAVNESVADGLRPHVGSDDESVRQRAAEQAAVTRQYENRLAMVRLGMATSLFYALRTKHAPTAAHSLRVALSCSAWCERLGLDPQQRDRIEVAALLHDIGKIGIPDRILRKPAKLTAEEQMSMDCCAEIGCEILRGCTDDQSLLEIVRHSGTWFESRRREDSPRGDAIPVGARMLAIASAFDSMTTDQVYRAAMSRERAIQELFLGSNTQFDPELTHDFAEMLEKRPEMLHECVVDRWLQRLQDPSADLFGKRSTIHRRTTAVPHPNPLASANASTDSGKWVSAAPATDRSGTDAGQGESRWDRPGAAFGESSTFYETLLRHSRDGVAFIDREGQILHWNDSMAMMTRVAAVACVGKQWDTSAFQFTSKSNDPCAVTECLERRIIVTRSMKVGHDKQSRRDVLLQALPVDEAAGGGCVITVRDMSDRAEMQHQIQSLHKKATSDPLTGVANRAEFDRRLLHCTTKAKQQGVTFSLIMCDIDHFKKVNDVHGHQAGDEALIEFANVLQRHTRGSDLVARYGGEEFAFLAINSDNATATRRAEEIRKAIAAAPLKGLGGESVTVSLGVTEYQTGDAPETVLARSDRALMQAKENGRNRVVQLGSGLIENETEAEPSGWLRWLTPGAATPQQEFELATPVPIDLAIEKLRGFIADHRAEIIHVAGNELSLRLNVRGGGGRRAADTQMTLNTVIRLSESRSSRGNRGGCFTLTKAKVTVTPVRNRDRRSTSFAPCVRQVISSLKSYLMAELTQQQGDH